MTEEKKNPVDWQQLQNVRREGETPRMGCRQVAGFLTLGLAGICLLLAVMATLDPRERIEPSRYLFVVMFTIGILMALAGWGLLRNPEPPPPSSQNH